ETEWSIVEGTYFSFITLSTIGFGDYVPGRNGPFDNISVVIELLIGAVYCVFGLAMLSMCMNLIQDELTAKLMWLSLKLGISQPEDFYSDDSDSSDSDSGSDEDAAGRHGGGNRTRSNRTRRSSVSLTPGGRKIIVND
uniref:Ion_trans_2 domain-containing protein n=1 Tax=Macrostomum lignano TaxID=282301 RepID=A0A1I8GL31_9PLAT